MKLIKTILILIGFFLLSFANAQTIERFLLSSAGHLHNGPQYHVSSTLGEIAINTLVSPESGKILTQGFQQGDEIIITAMDTPVSQENLVIWPVPATSEINIQVPEGLIGSRILILNVLGDYNRTHIIENTVTEIDVSGLPSGTYFIKISGTQGASQIIKI